MKVISNLLASAAILAAGVANAGNLEVTHWWTSGGEAAAVSVLAEKFNAQTNQVIKKLFVKADPRLVLVATEIVQDGILNSAAPGDGEVVDGWYDKANAYWVKRSKYFFDIVEYFGVIICVSEEIYKSLKKMNLKSLEFLMLIIF